MKKNATLLIFLAIFVLTMFACTFSNTVKIREISNVEDWIAAPEGYDVVIKCYMIKNPPEDFDELRTLVREYLDHNFDGYVYNNERPILYKCFFYRTSKKFPWDWKSNHAYMSEDQIYHHTDDMIAAIRWEPQDELREYTIMQKSTSSKTYGMTIRRVRYLGDDIVPSQY